MLNSSITYSLQQSEYDPQDYVFVFAATAEVYPALRSAIYSLIVVFQYSYKRLIIYDLGGLKTNPLIVGP